MGDFEISKYLKNKMKEQWVQTYKRIKKLKVNSYKAHESYASKIITQHAINFRRSKSVQ